MKELAETIAKQFPLLPFWYKVLVLSWSIGLIALLALGLLLRTSPPATSPKRIAWPETGDDGFDHVHRELNELKAASATVVNADVSRVLRPAFSRIGFVYIEEERPESLLFALCRARKLLEYYGPRLSDPAEKRYHASRAAMKTIKMGDHLAQLFGSGFSPETHCERYGSTRADFIAQLPPRLDQPSPHFRQTANDILKEFREELRLSDLADF